MYIVINIDKPESKYHLFGLQIMQNANHKSTEVEYWPELINFEVISNHILMSNSNSKEECPSYEYIFIYSWILLDNSIKNTKEYNHSREDDSKIFSKRMVTIEEYPNCNSNS